MPGVRRSFGLAQRQGLRGDRPDVYQQERAIRRLHRLATGTHAPVPDTTGPRQRRALRYWRGFRGRSLREVANPPAAQARWSFKRGTSFESGSLDQLSCFSTTYRASPRPVAGPPTRGCRALRRDYDEVGSSAHRWSVQANSMTPAEVERRQGITARGTTERVVRSCRRALESDKPAARRRHVGPDHCRGTSVAASQGRAPARPGRHPRPAVRLSTRFRRQLPPGVAVCADVIRGWLPPGVGLADVTRRSARVVPLEAVRAATTARRGTCP